MEIVKSRLKVLRAMEYVLNSHDYIQLEKAGHITEDEARPFVDAFDVEGLKRLIKQRIAPQYELLSTNKLRQLARAAGITKISVKSRQRLIEELKSC